MHKDKVVRFTSHSGDHLSSVVFFCFYSGTVRRARKGSINVSQLKDLAVVTSFNLWLNPPACVVQ